MTPATSSSVTTHPHHVLSAYQERKQSERWRQLFRPLVRVKAQAEPPKRAESKKKVKDPGRRPVSSLSGRQEQAPGPCQELSLGAEVQAKKEALSILHARQQGAAGSLGLWGAPCGLYAASSRGDSPSVPRIVGV